MDRSKVRLQGDYEMHLGIGTVPNMRVPAVCYADSELRRSLENDINRMNSSGGVSNLGAFIPSVAQVANVAGLPGIVKQSIGLPDLHTGYGFGIGNICAVDVNNAESVVSPGGIGFDINCGVRVVRTNLFAKDISDVGVREKLAQAIFDHIPVGVGSEGILPATNDVLCDALVHGMDWSLREGYAWPEDKEHCEEYGRMMMADPSCVSTRAMKRGLPQLGTLGAGNHFLEVQVVDEVYDKYAARRLGLERDQVIVMIHSGSRGFGHQVATDALVVMEQHMAKEGIVVNDPQLACARINSETGQNYLKGMACAANYAWVNRSAMTFLVRQAFSSVFGETPDDLDMNLIYDVSHNIAKFEEHIVDGKAMSLLLHRKGATRAFPPFHPNIPVDYQACGQPVLIGGSMGTNSHIMLGTETAMQRTFGSTCHGAGRAASRAAQRRNNDYRETLSDMTDKDISIRVASPNLLMEEASDAYKDVNRVVEVCHALGFSKKCVRTKPRVVVKG